ncbi:MAG TPA: hypothetical protein VNP98_04895 [Chthoniobacterales bacterium]|nr:hypothetical protein [Chthoniobacterales bacterium]
MKFFSFSHQSGVKVVFEDNDRCAYAYFLNESGQILGDVWIYNSDFTPDHREWEGDSEPPFRNASQYVQNHPFPRVQSEDEIAVSFEFESEAADQLIVSIYIRETLTAMLKANARPGWSANARIDGPLALRLDPASSPKAAGEL